MKTYFRSGILFLLIIIGIDCAMAQNRRSPVIKDSLQLDEVVITGTRSEVNVRLLPMNVSVIGKQQISDRHMPSVLPLITEQVPGLFVTGRGLIGYGVSAGAAGAMNLRGVGGGPTTGLLVLIDGHPQYMGLMGHPIADAYQSMWAEKVEVVSGPASILYGSNAMGGAINIVTRKQQTDGMRTNAQVMYGSYNTLSAEVGNQLRKGRFSSFVSGNYNRTDGHRERMDFEQYGGYGKLGYDFSRSWKAFADVNLTRFNAANPGSVASPLFDNDSEITRGMASFSLENEYECTSGALKLFYNWGKHFINDGYKPGTTPLDYRFHSRDKMLGLTWYQTVNLLAGNQTTFGFDYQQFGGEAWQQYANRRVEMADKTLYEWAGYVNSRQQLGDKLTLNAGVRVDYHELTGVEWIPQAGASWAVNEHSVLKAIVSKGFRNPTIREMYMFPPQNPDLLPERLMSYELSFAQHLSGNRLYYSGSVYYLNGDNMIQTVPVDGKPKNLNMGKIENYGVELVVRYRLGKEWSVSGNYSWLHMKYKVVAAPEHKVYAGAFYTPKRWSFSTRVQYVAGLYTLVTPTKKTESFVLWNLQGAYRLGRFAQVFVKGENLLAQRYEINAGYPMPRATVMGGVRLDF